MRSQCLRGNECKLIFKSLLSFPKEVFVNFICVEKYRGSRNVIKSLLFALELVKIIK